MQKILSNEFYQGQKRCPRFSEIVVVVVVVRASEECTLVVAGVRNNTVVPPLPPLEKKPLFFDFG